MFTCNKYRTAGANKVRGYRDWYVAKARNTALSKALPAKQENKIIATANNH